MNTREFIKEFTGGGVRDELLRLEEASLNSLTEIRIRANRPMAVKFYGKEKFLSGGRLFDSPEKGYKPGVADINATLEHMSNFSLYAFEDELKNGYITLPGGHRVGFSGRAVTEDSKVKTIKSVSGFNIRLSHEVKGCGLAVLPYISKPLRHTMIISPPCCGKTTLLRDVVRLLSNEGHNVGVVDERSEIGGCFMGLPQNDLGIRGDVLDGCPKAEGMVMLLRSMSPDVIAVDEIGRREDIYAIEDVLNCGVTILCTAHGESMEDLRKKPVLSELLGKKIFERFILLSGRKKPGEVAAIYDGNGKKLYGGGEDGV